LWFFEERPVLAWAAMAAGALTKGPLAIALPLLVLVPHALATGLPLRRLFSWRAVGAFALIALPWFIAVSIRVPAFPYYVVVRETLQRVTTGTFHRTAPFWYFFPIVPVAAFPWIVPALARTRTWRATWRARRAPSAREPLLFASWIIVPLVFFTLNQSKLPQYVLPLMPACVPAGALIRRPRAVIAGYAMVVMAIPLVSGRLLAAVGDDRSAAALARAAAAALGQGNTPAGTTAVLGVLAYPPSLPFYLGRPIAVAAATGLGLTSNYIADYQDRYRDVPGSPLLPEGYWREALARCPVPTVIVAT